MVTVIDVVGLLVILGVNAAVSALTMRFLRVRLETQWGPVAFALFIIPVLLTFTTLLFGGLLQLGFDLGSTAAVVGLTMVLPMALGIAFDYFWMPSPDEVELPERYQQGEAQRR